MSRWTCTEAPSGEGGPVPFFLKKNCSPVPQKIKILIAYVPHNCVCSHVPFIVGLFSCSPEKKKCPYSPISLKPLKGFDSVLKFHSLVS